MRRLLAWLGCAAGAAWMLRRLRGRPEPTLVADPADELRRKLDESRVEEQAAASPEAPAAGLDERRREVHDRGRAAIEAMRRRGGKRE